MAKQNPTEVIYFTVWDGRLMLEKCASLGGAIATWKYDIEHPEMPTGKALGIYDPNNGRLFISPMVPNSVKEPQRVARKMLGQEGRPIKQVIELTLSKKKGCLNVQQV